MSISPVAGLMSLAQRLFPHRQFYLRSRGSVQFFEFTSTFQITVVGATLVLLCWVAYASVVAIFKEQIITAKDERYADMQTAYATRVTQMQRTYDELSSLLVLAEERFQNATRSLEAKRGQLTALLMQKQTMDKQLRDVRRQAAVMENYRGRADQFASNAGANVLMTLPDAAESSARQGRIQTNATDSTIAKIQTAIRRSGSELRQNIVMQRIARLEGRLNGIQKQQLALLGELRQTGNNEMEKYQRVLAMTGLDVDQAANQIGARGRGGPFLSLGATRASEGLGDEFEKLFSDVARTYDRLDSFATAVSRIPLVTPIAQGLYHTSSSFGYRADPLTGRLAFHSGADLAGTYGTPVLCTAPGRVVASERRGGYGLMVEIDHGRGIRTRYGHLQSTLVKVGDAVQFRDKIATMGSSGRSTGPHVHYEIWFNDKVRDPTKFFDAGQSVFRW